MLSLIIFFVGCLFLLSAIFLYFRAQHVLDRLDNILDSAVSGTFQPSCYDESQISRTEQKFSQFLSASILSRNALDTDRARIQALIGDIAHQSRTPIANILLYTGLLAEEPLTDGQRALVDQAISQTEKLGFLIDSLVKTSRLESGMVQVSPIYSPLSDLLCHLEDSFAPEAQRNHIDFTVEPCDIYAVFDPKWTAEAIGNLIDNAIKYTPSGGSVRVFTEVFELFCAIVVEDTGAGIAEHEHAKIFSRFYRSPEMAAVSGVGIGLYLTREILHKQNGYIKLSSTSGHGAKFSAFLPRDI
ncbi:MAG: HAMP domain-containing sensor histidine kinase [Butyricicoccus pullicaecorum]|nr:HAMP domain-containing histidine kinase [Butyricicoccus pullicaecorum]MDO4668505.1 HAMP domain-containing sensor histidine kinase [Butyricicoccus pullicaecorum]